MNNKKWVRADTSRIGAFQVRLWLAGEERGRSGARAFIETTTLVRGKTELASWCVSIMKKLGTIDHTFFLEALIEISVIFCKV